MLDRGADQGWVWGDEGAEVPADAPMHALLSVALRSLGQHWWHITQGMGISSAGLGVLRVVVARDGLKSSEVAARGWCTPGTLTSVVNTLVRDGYVERRGDEGDRRVVRLYATELGRRKCRQAMSQLPPYLGNSFDYLDPADEPVVRKFLVDTIQRYSKLAREGRGT
ncbi:MAG TPA: MarR family winged helix-turn-helix transcriptional regulator [Streptosporangiaceae bacterium]